MRQLRNATLVVSVCLGSACATAPKSSVLDSYPAGVNGRTTVEYYDVHGRTAAELRADMRRLGPKIADSSFVGETRSPMKWTWKSESGGGSMCSVKEARVTITAQILLPRWTPPADAEPELVTEWNRFVAALETHEAGHKDIAAKAAHDLAERFRDMSAMCSLLSTRANDISRGILDKAELQQRAYDAETRHGATQGTSFGGNSRLGPGLFAGAPDKLVLLAAPRAGTALAFLSVSLDSAWRALPLAFAAMGLTVNAIDGAAHVAGDSLTVRGTIAGAPVGDVVDCGTVPTDGSAGSVTFFVTSRLATSDSSRTTVTNTVQAFTRNAGATAVACRSHGVLERRLLQELRRQLGL